MSTTNTKIFYLNIDLAKNILFNSRLHPVNNTEMTNLSSTLTVDDDGLVVYNNEQKFYYGWDGTSFVKIGIDSFLGLKDTPDTFVANKYLRVKSDATGIEFVDITIPEYILPKASNSTLGGVKIGTGISIDNDGVISVNPYTVPSLQQVTNVGNTTSNNILIDNDDIIADLGYSINNSELGGFILIGKDKLQQFNGDIKLNLNPEELFSVSVLGTNTASSAIIFAADTAGWRHSRFNLLKNEELDFSNRTYYLPNADGTIALQEWVTAQNYLTTSTASNIYQPLESKLTSLSSLNNTTNGLLRYNNGVASYDTNTYLTTISGLNISQLSNDSGYITSSSLTPYLTTSSAALTYQPILVSGTNIKTINNESLLGSGNISIVTSAAGVTGSIQYRDATGGFAGSDSFIWNNTSRVLGIGTSSPITGSGSAIHIYNNLNDGTPNSNSTFLAESLFRNAVFVARITTGAAGGLVVENNSGTNLGRFTVTNNGTNSTLAIGVNGNSNFLVENNNNITSQISNSITNTAITDYFTYRSIFGNLGAGTTITNMYGYFTSAGLNNAAITNVYGFYGNIPINTNRWNLYMNGTARNYMRGELMLNTLTSNGYELQVNGENQTGSSAVGAASITQTWNTTGSPTAFLMNITNTASGANSRLIDLQVGGSSRFRVSPNGDVLINGTSQNASAILQIDSTTKGFLPPRMTTSNKNSIASPATGLLLYDTDLNRPEYYNGSSWIGLLATPGGSNTQIQFNNNGVFGGSNDFTWNNTTRTLILGTPQIGQNSINANGTISSNTSFNISGQASFTNVGFPTSATRISRGNGMSLFVHDDKSVTIIDAATFTAIASSIFTVVSTTKGSIPYPRMTAAQRTAITVTSANISMHVYQTDGTEGVYVYKSSGWVFAY